MCRISIKEYTNSIFINSSDCPKFEIIKRLDTLSSSKIRRVFNECKNGVNNYDIVGVRIYFSKFIYSTKASAYRGYLFVTLKDFLKFSTLNIISSFSICKF